MVSHNFRTGLLKRKTFHKKDIWNLCHSLTPAQSSFFRECFLQLLGKEPSEYWGKQKIWFDLPKVDRKTLLYVLESLNHPAHITSMKLSKNKKAGNAFSSAATHIAEFGAKAGKYIKKGVEVAGKVWDVAQKVSTGIGVAHDWGLIGDDSALNDANDMFQSLTGMAGSGFDPKPVGVRRK